MWPQPPHYYTNVRPKDRFRIVIAYFDTIVSNPLPCIFWEYTDSPYDVADALISINKMSVFETALFAIISKYNESVESDRSFICEILSILLSNQTLLNNSEGRESLSEYALPILASSIIRGQYYPSLFRYYLPEKLFSLISIWSQGPPIRPENIEVLAMGGKARGTNNDNMLINGRFEMRFDIIQIVFGGPSFIKHYDRIYSFASNGKSSALESEILFLLRSLGVKG